MCQQEKRAIVSLIMNTVTFSLFFMYSLELYYQSSYTVHGELKFWATAILLLIPTLIIAQVIGHILYVIYETVTSQKEYRDIMDELDRLIDLKSARNFSHVFLLCFFLSLLSVVIYIDVFLMCMILINGIYVASLSMDISQIVYYRRGVTA